MEESRSSTSIPTSATMSVPEAGRLLGVSRETAYKAVHAGQIPALRIGKRLVVPREAFERLMAEPAGLQPDEVGTAGRPL
jgi:excisionase family DNA binding protein